MSRYEVPEPILNSPFEEPGFHWQIQEGVPCEKRDGRRLSVYHYRPPKVETGREQGSDIGTTVELKLVNLIRDRVKEWRKNSYEGVSKITRELLHWWSRDGRQKPLFFAQREAVETLLFLVEARSDFRQGISVPRDEPSDERKSTGYSGFTRFACKMATGSGKTTVMAMVAAWSILNKLNARSDPRFSDVVLAVCPNVTIRERLQELDPRRGHASLFVTRDLVPPHLRTLLSQGRVLVTNWHVLEPQDLSGGNRVDRRGHESDSALVARVLGKEVGGKQNILVLNDEAHHAYRIRQQEPDAIEEDLFGDEEEADQQAREATVWIEGLDRIHRIRGINLCIDLSATPYYLSRVGSDANRPFPWVVSDFGLVDAIESGLVKIPQLAVQDTTGREIPAYFNVWRWIMEPGRLSPAERGGSKAQPKPEAILKWAQTPIAQLGGLWEQTFEQWRLLPDQHPTPPVFIIVCKNTRIAKLVYEWLAEGDQPVGIAPSKLESFRNRDGKINTIRVDSKVVQETDTGEARDDESRWMRLTLDTVGKTSWPTDAQGKAVLPPGFEELAEKLHRPLHPPGRDVRCIVSVGMLTEGWDCTTVTHIIGLRPFMSQLLCEQVVGRGLRRTSYEVGENDLFTEETVKVYGVPFEVVPFKANPQGAPPQPVHRWHVHSLPAKESLEIKFPRVEGYTFAIRNRVDLDWERAAPVVLNPAEIPPGSIVKGLSFSDQGTHSLHGPGQTERVTLEEFRSKRRIQELEFDLAKALTQHVMSSGQCQIPPQSLFPQMHRIALRYLKEKVDVVRGTDLKDVFLSPYYGWVIERLSAALRPDTTSGEAPEVPRYESNRLPGSTRDVDFWTSRSVMEIQKSHLNYVVADTCTWEQSTAYYLDQSELVEAFAKNAGLGFAVPYLHDGKLHDYVPDFLVRIRSKTKILGTLILETKGFDPLKEVKAAAAERWVKAVNADGSFGNWIYRVVRDPTATDSILEEAVKALGR